MTLNDLFMDISEGTTTDTQAQNLAMALGFLWDYSQHGDFREIMRRAGFEIDDESKRMLSQHLIDL
jgi:hypothetical protein